ncbi:hypothetical protein SAMN02745111_01154 [Eubacterium uniforme]|uniref:Uncharacterized protein n=1 Tax=Eubacterium uniforme TaxID=39495 RepID=A0A1T4VL54_9FIRM|nr:ribonuclease D [Eubacterium uniforme]SKA65647.1 hypothetical protein SAMN02745111_01154 [Eubacterium uniforme]
MEYVTRINLKTATNERQKLVDYCLGNEKEQYVAIGWSYIYDSGKKSFKDYKEFWYAVEENIKSRRGRINPALNLFWNVKENDLFWTRDLDGVYWICRARGEAESKCFDELDIGAVVPVEAYKVGLEVPGILKASFNRPRGGIVHKIKDDIFINYSKYVYNKISNTEIYKDIAYGNGNIIDTLPDFELEELVISYIQIKDNYYLISNSIANKSTTIKIECEFISRDKNNIRKAVVQVKGGNAQIDASDYKEYIKQGYSVYLYAGGGVYSVTDDYIVITKEQLKEFYFEYKDILPDDITKWENLFN